jgi:signal transduction histidine kinase
VQLQVKVTGTDIDLLVSDNGKGFDPSRVARGMACASCVSAQMIGGYVAVESGPASAHAAPLLKREEVAA